MALYSIFCANFFIQDSGCSSDTQGGIPHDQCLLYLSRLCYVIAWVICFIFCKHEVQSKLFICAMYWMPCIMGWYLSYQNLVSVGEVDFKISSLFTKSPGVWFLLEPSEFGTGWNIFIGMASSAKLFYKRY